MPGIEFRQEIIGAKDFQNSLARWSMMIDSAPMRKAYDMIIERIRADIMNNRVPVRTGYLRSTVYGEMVQMWPLVEMRFGARAHYASYVHENHKTRGQFVTRSVEAHQAWVTDTLVWAVREVLSA